MLHLPTCFFCLLLSFSLSLRSSCCLLFFRFFRFNFFRFAPFAFLTGDWTLNILCCAHKRKRSRQNNLFWWKYAFDFQNFVFRNIRLNFYTSFKLPEILDLNRIKHQHFDRHFFEFPCEKSNFQKCSKSKGSTSFTAERCSDVLKRKNLNWCPKPAHQIRLDDLRERKKKRHGNQAMNDHK